MRNLYKMHILGSYSVPIIPLACLSIAILIQAGLAKGETYHYQCHPNPKKCTEWVCPDECPTTYNGDTSVNLTCWIDCNSPDCSAQCYDWVNFAQTIKCETPGSKCFGKLVRCPRECPFAYSQENDSERACYVECNSPNCEAKCGYRKPNCDSLGSACFDPRFIGGDASIFYFHGKKQESYNLVSDLNLLINGRFIGHRPRGRTRDFTWIQALGILFKSHIFSLEATKAPTWDDKVDHLKFNSNGQDVTIPEESLSRWYSQDSSIILERISPKNNVIVSLKDRAEILVNVVPITKQDDRVHRYQVPSDNCFVHLEVQFRFLNLSSMVDGVLGRTYRPDFENPAKVGVEMPVLGGEDSYRTTSLLARDCKLCVSSFESGLDQGDHSLSVSNHPALDCSGNTPGGYGIVCKK